MLFTWSNVIRGVKHIYSGHGGLGGAAYIIVTTAIVLQGDIHALFVLQAGGFSIVAL